MKTQFQKKVRLNRKRLREAGYPASTIHTWEYGKKTPIYVTAEKLAILLDMKISDIPYRKVEVNVP